MRKLWKAVSRYLIFFLLVAFVVTCCMSLFVSTLSESLHLVLSEENLNIAAKLTFANVVLLSVLFAVIDAVRRKFTVQIPAKRITDAAKKIMDGDYTVRIPLQKSMLSDDVFLEISDCFNKMAEELGSVETLRTDFIANVSHEMKTPLSVIQNYGTLLQAPNLPEEKRVEYARGITEASRRTADMMTNILKLNRLENQQIFPKISPYNLSEQICECLLQYENVWEKKGIEIDTDLAEDVVIAADRELLNLVWSNLFSNAFKFTEADGTVTVRLMAEEHEVTVLVKDTGCGMNAETGAHIFEKFYQGDTSHSAQGNGLGLALVKRVVDILRGEISVESTVGVGTAFMVTLRRN